MVQDLPLDASKALMELQSRICKTGEESLRRTLATVLYDMFSHRQDTIERKISKNVTFGANKYDTSMSMSQH